MTGNERGQFMHGRSQWRLSLSRWGRGPVWLLVGLHLAGCSHANSAGEVEGVVTRDGQPLACVQVLFLPAEGPSSRALTDEGGHFRLVMTTGQESAMIGVHRVCLSDVLAVPLPKSFHPDALANAVEKAKVERAHYGTKVCRPREVVGSVEESPCGSREFQSPIATRSKRPCNLLK